MASHRLKSPARTTQATKRKLGKVTELDAVSPRTTSLDVTQQELTDRPTVSTTSIANICTRARQYRRDNQWLSTFLSLKRDVVAYGMRIKAGPNPQTGDKPTDEDQKKLKQWLAQTEKQLVDSDVPIGNETITVESQRSQEEVVLKFIEDVISERVLLDIAVGCWSDNFNLCTLPPEKCTFRDTLGVPILSYNSGLTADELKLLPEEQRERFKKAFYLNAKLGEHFKVLKLARDGDGFGIPGIYSIFRLLGEMESKEIGMYLMSFCLRKVTRHHKLGHEITSGERAGLPKHFWTQGRSDKVMNRWQGKVGLDDFTSNFDHTIEYPWPETKYFDGTYFKDSTERLIQWGGPLAEVMIATQQMPYIMPMLKASIVKIRQEIARFVEPILMAALKPPVPIKLSFSNTIFNEARLQAEMLKFATIQGLASGQTAREEIGLNSEEEVELKKAEAADPDRKAITYPTWDSSHGVSPLDVDLSAKKAGSAGKGQSADSQPGTPPGGQHNS